MIAKSTCQHCGGGFEFDLEQFEPSGGAGESAFGQTIDCPHCGQSTIVTLRQNPFAARPTATSAPESKASRIFKWILLGVGAILLLVLIYELIHNWQFIGESIAGIFPIVGGALGGLVLLFVGIITIILGVLWTFFPWFVYFKLNRLNALLEKIEINTRK